MKSFANRKIWPLPLLLIITVIFYWKVFFRGLVPFPGDMLVGSYFPWLDSKWGNIVGVAVKNPLITDVFSQLYPWKSLIAESFRNFQWPLWNPYSYSGYPLLANFQSGAFNPFNLLMVIFGNIPGWSLLIVAQNLGAAITMYLFLRHSKFSPLASTIAAITYAFGGFMTVWSQFATAGFAMIWLPLIFICADNYLCRSKLRHLLPLPLLLFLIMSSGHIQALIYSLIITTIYFLAHRFNRTTITHLSVIYLLAIALMAIQLLPTFDLLRDSIRFDEVYISQINFGLLPISQLITLVAPDFFGNPTTMNYWGFYNYFETTIYSSVAALLALVFSIYHFRKLSPSLRFFLFGALTSLLFIFDNPISQLFFHLKVPFLSTSAAGRLGFILAFCLSPLVANFIDTIPRLKFKQLFRIYWGIFLCFITYIVIAYICWRYFGVINSQISLRNSILPLCLFLTFATITILFKKTCLLKPLLLALVIFDLFRFGWKYLPFVSPQLVFPTTDVISFLQKDPDIFRIDREKAQILPPNTWTEYRLMSPSGYDPSALKSYTLYYNHTINGSDSLVPSRYSELDRYDAPVLGNQNVKYLLALKHTATDEIKASGDRYSYKIDLTDWQPVYQKDTVTVFLNRFYQPRARWKNPTLAPPPQITSYTPGKIIINYQLSSSNSLVLADTYAPGWQASIDSFAFPVSSDDHLLRVVNNLPAGHHQLIFSYHPLSFSLGLAVTTLGLLIYLILFIKTKS